MITAWSAANCSGRCSPTSVNVNLLLLRLRLDVVLGDSSAPQSH